MKSIDNHKQICRELASEFVSRYNYNVLDSKDAPNKLCKRLVKPKL